MTNSIYEAYSSLLRGSVITIGVGAPLSGMAAALGREMTQAVELAVSEVNHGDGLLGAQIDITVRDDEGDVRKGRK